jgi:hypothetical protein
MRLWILAEEWIAALADAKIPAIVGIWHKAFAPELWSNWALVVIGVFGTWAALRTLRSIEKQTKVLVESQRPKLTASASTDPSKTLADRAARRVLIALENKGMTSAYDVFYEHWIEILPFPFQDFTPRADYFKCPHVMVLYPSEPMALNIPIQREVSAEEMHAVLELQLYVCIRIHVTYRDAFGPREANFGYYAVKGGLGILPKYNDFK